MTDQPTNDQCLLQAWQARGDELAFHALCQRHAALVAAGCQRLGSPDADEAAQAVFMLLARQAGSVDGLGGIRRAMAPAGRLDEAGVPFAQNAK
jgi:hypothetical protein